MGNEYSGVGLALDADVGVGVALFEEHIVHRLVLLDEVVFEEEASCSLLTTMYSTVWKELRRACVFLSSWCF